MFDWLIEETNSKIIFYYFTLLILLIAFLFQNYKIVLNKLLNIKNRLS